MDGAGTACGNARAELACELGVRGRRHSGELFMRHLNELDALFLATHRAHHTVHPVTRKAVDALDAPADQPIDECIADSPFFWHVPSRFGPVRRARSVPGSAIVTRTSNKTDVVVIGAGAAGLAAARALN